MAKGPSKENETPSRRFATNLPIEGVFLHVRAIIEQGRTEDFLRACKDQGFLSLKGQRGIVAFARAFIEEGHGAERESTAASSLAEPNRFAVAVLNKPKVDHC